MAAALNLMARMVQVVPRLALGVITTGVWLAVLAQEPAPAAPASINTTNRFDGDWTVRVDCPADAPAADSRGVAYDFPASVLNGRLFGSNGEQGAAGSLQIEGSIATDGSATLQARGRGSAAGGSAYSYDVESRFADGRGSGRRAQDDACRFAFARR